MMDQYKKSGPKIEAKVESDVPTSFKLRIEMLEAKLHKQDQEISFLRREIGRLKSDLDNTINFVRKRG